MTDSNKQDSPTKATEQERLHRLVFFSRFGASLGC